jgi:hypothetical protein
MGDSSLGFYLAVVPVVFLLLTFASFGLAIVVARTRSRPMRIILGLWLIFLAFIGFITPVLSVVLSLVFSPILGILGLIMLIAAWRLTEE